MVSIKSSPQERAEAEFWLNQDQIPMSPEERLQRHLTDVQTALTKRIEEFTTVNNRLLNTLKSQPSLSVTIVQMEVLNEFVTNVVEGDFIRVFGKSVGKHLWEKLNKCRFDITTLFNSLDTNNRIALITLINEVDKCGGERYWFCELSENNGGREYTHKLLIVADDIEQAQRTLDSEAAGWYDHDVDPETGDEIPGGEWSDDAGGYYHDGQAVMVRTSRIMEITREEWLIFRRHMDFVRAK